MRSFRLCGLLPFRVSTTRVLFRLKCLNVQTNKGISNSRADDFQQKWQPHSEWAAFFFGGGRRESFKSTRNGRAYRPTEKRAISKIWRKRITLAIIVLIVDIWRQTYPFFHDFAQNAVVIEKLPPSFVYKYFNECKQFVTITSLTMGAIAKLDSKEKCNAFEYCWAMIKRLCIEFKISRMYPDGGAKRASETLIADGVT